MDTEKGVGQTLLLNGGCGTVAGIHPEVVTEGENFSPNPFDELIMIPTREIGSPHGAGKERVPSKHSAIRIKAHPTRRMTGGVDNRDGIGAYIDLLSFFKIPVRLEIQR